MFSVRQLSQQIAALDPDQFGAFEDWFRAESRDAHSDRDDEIVFAVEDVLSRYHHEHLRGDALKRELANAVLPFAPVLQLGEIRCFEIPVQTGTNSAVDVQPPSKLATSAANRWRLHLSAA